ncbi:MAG: polymer-forming cytoskeletal protein [Saprospiraceae bacterium]|nr:polymer-forming cytoskeletal protein [Saprospiraceae bacterium]
MKKTVATQAPITSSNSLVKGTRIEGKMHTESDIRIDGVLVGSLKSKGKVIVGATGQIEGDIQCVNAVIEGRFSGNLMVQELLQVKETAHIEGDVNTSKLIVQSGAIFNVNCSMGGQKVKDLSADPSKPLELHKLSKVVSES